MLYQVYIMLYLEHVVVEEVTVWKVWVPCHCYQIGAQVERDLHCEGLKPLKLYHYFDVTMSSSLYLSMAVTD